MRVSGRRLLFVVFTSGLLLAGTVHAAGFAIFEQGGKAMGMAGAFGAVADDPSAMYYNLGGVAFIDEREFYAGFSLISLGDSTYTAIPTDPTRDGEQVDQIVVPPHFYWVEPLGEKLRFGLGLNSPFGLVTEWENPSTWSGRFISQKAELIDIDLNPNLAYKVNDRLGIAIGAIVRFSTVELKSVVPVMALGFPQSVLESDTDTGFGANFGLLFKATDRFSLGFNYRSKIDIDYGGDATFTPQPPMNTSIGTSIEFPDQATLGFAYRFGGKWIADVDFIYTGWSTFDQLVIDYNPPAAPLPTPVTRPQNWDNSYSVRGGAQYMVSGSSRIRFGAYYDESPQPDETVSPLLPDANRIGYSVGYGYAGKSIDVDAYFLYVDFDERTTTTNLDGFNGTYDTDVFILGASIGF